MANYANTVLLNALTDLTDRANKDLRAPQYGATRAFNEYKRDVILNFDEFRDADKTGLRTLQVDYLRRASESVGSSRSASLTGAMGTSTRDALTFVTYTREFTLSDDNAKNNTQGATKQLVHQIRNARLDIGAAIETAAITKLEAFRNQVEVSSSLSTWDSVGYVNKVANADEDRYFNIITSQMQQRDYNGGIQLVNTHDLNELKYWQTAQGAANSSNLQFQYDNKTFYTSNSITNGSDYIGTTYAVEDYSLGLVDWIPSKNRTGMMDHANWDFTNIPDPFGIFDSMALAVQKKVQDSSSAGSTDIGGNTQDAVWLYELSVDIGYFIPTITTQKLVNKYGLLKS